MIGPCQRCGQERTLRKGILCIPCDQSLRVSKHKLHIRYMSNMCDNGRERAALKRRKPAPVSLPVVRLP